MAACVFALLLQLQRLMRRDGSSSDEAQARIDAQLPLSVKEQLADVVLHNDGDIGQLQDQVGVGGTWACDGCGRGQEAGGG